MNRYSSNKYILITIGYAIKWVEVKVLRTNMVVIAIKILHDHIVTQFGCPLTIVTDQGTYFINDLICYLTIISY